VLLRLRAQPREDTDLSPAEAIFGTPIVLPIDFFQTEEISVDSIIKNFSKLWMTLLPRHNSSVQLPSGLPAGSSLPPCLGPSRRRSPSSPPTLRRSLHRSALRPPLLHHPSRVTRQGHRPQPPPGLHGSKR
jgi:hypothetical protein